MKKTTVVSMLLAAAAMSSCAKAALADGGAPNTVDQPAALSQSPATVAPSAPEKRKGAAIANWRTGLLDLAFAAVSQLPTNPHKKNRCRLQAAVVAACLRLDQPDRAVRFARRIDDWRRGVALADWAIHRARHGDQDLTAVLDEAEKAATAVLADPDQQPWRAERIRTRIAMAFMELGAQEDARKAIAGVGSVEAGRMAALRVLRGGEEMFAQHRKEVEVILQTGDLDNSKTALGACAELFDAYYADAEKRSAMQQAVMSATKVPLEIRLDLTSRLVEAALAHADPATALTLAEQMRFDIDGPNWLPESKVAFMGRHAELLGRAGDRKAGRERIAKALVEYEAGLERIHEIFRADALLPVAEAWQAVGDTQQARAMYLRAIAAAATTPNSWPRVEDLLAICCSMALADVEPDAKVTASLQRLQASLRDPW